MTRQLVSSFQGRQDADLWYDPGSDRLYYFQGDEIRNSSVDFQNTSLFLATQMSSYNGIAVDYHVGIKVIFSFM